MVPRLLAWSTVINDPTGFELKTLLHTSLITFDHSFFYCKKLFSIQKTDMAFFFLHSLNFFYRSLH